MKKNQFQSSNIPITILLLRSKYLKIFTRRKSKKKKPNPNDDNDESSETFTIPIIPENGSSEYITSERINFRETIDRFGSRVTDIRTCATGLRSSAAIVSYLFLRSSPLDPLLPLGHPYIHTYIRSSVCLRFRRRTVNHVH